VDQAAQPGGDKMESNHDNTIAVLTTDRSVDDKQINEELRSIWELLQKDERLRGQARQAGIDDAVLQVLKECPYSSEVREGQIGVAETIFIAFASQLARDAAKTLWDKVIWPRLTRRFGAAVEQKPNDVRR
jgi:hypothetical protein